MKLHSLHLYGIFCVFLFQFSFASERQFTPFSINSAKTSGLSISNGTKQIPLLVLDINADELIRLKTAAGTSVDISLPLPANKENSVVLHLEPFEIFSDDAKVVTGTEQGDVNAAKPSTALFKGVIEGKENSFAYFGIVNNHIYAFIDDKEHTYLISERSDSKESAYVVFREDDLNGLNPPLECGSDDLQLPKELKQIQQEFLPNIITPSKKLTVAVDCDYEYYSKFGTSVDSAAAYVTNIFSAVASIYQTELNITVRISYLRIWATAKDPWGAKTTGKALSELQKFWNANMSGVHRNIVHFISGKSLGGGVAYIDILRDASKPYAYGVSQILKDYKPLPVWSWDVNVVSHEIGHNLGSYHTHNCRWVPMLDSCYKTEGTCYTGSIVVRKGTIMSYCHLTSAGVELTFGTRVKAYLVGHTDSVMAGEAPIYYNTSFRTFPAESLASAAVAVTAGMPNFANVANSVFDKKRLADGLYAGIPQPKATIKNYGWLHITKTKSLKTFFPQNDSIQGFTFVKEKKDPIVKKYHNKLAGDVITARFNLYASMFGIVPEGLGQLKYYEPGHPLHNKTIEQIVNKVDSNLTYTGGVSAATYVMEDSVLVKINKEFSGALDTISFAGYLRLKGVKSIGSVSYLKLDSSGSAAPPIAVRGVHFAGAPSLIGNFPNPFNPVTVIRYSLPGNSIVSLKVYNILGQEVATLINNELTDAGEHAVEFDATHLSSGVYFSRLITEGKTVMNKMLLLK